MDGCRKEPSNFAPGKLVVESRAVSISFTDELSCFIQSIENLENFSDSGPFPKKAHSLGGVDECQCAVRPEYRRVGADHFTAAARIEVGHFGKIDHKSPYARLKLVQHMFAKADKRPVVNHSSGDFDEIDVVFHFRGNLHAPTVFSDSIRVKILCVLKAIGDARGIAPVEEIPFDVVAVGVMADLAFLLMLIGMGFCRAERGTVSPPVQSNFFRCSETGIVLRSLRGLQGAIQWALTDPRFLPAPDHFPVHARSVCFPRANRRGHSRCS